MHPEVNLGSIGDSGAQEGGIRRGGHVSGSEENQGELQGVRGGNGDALSSSPHGETTRNSPATDRWGRCQQRGGRYICGVFSAGTKVGGVPSRQMPGKGEQTR